MRRAVVLVLVAGAVLGLCGPAVADEGPWGWPLEGAPAVARPFAPPETRYGAGHRGVDLAAAPGQPVLAAGAGRVSYAGLLAGRGVVVVVHGALRTTYEPVAASIAVGSSVAAGDVIGALEPGHLGCPAAACLHWGLRRGEQYLDPVRLVRRGPVRLLPVRGAEAAAGDREPVINDGLDQQPGPATEPGRTVDAPPPEVAEPAWSLRAAEAPLGMAALAALVVGIGLLARPRPLPPGPVSGGVPAPAAPAREAPVLPAAALLDLDQARVRRRAAS